MTGGQDHSGDAVRQRLAEISAREQAATEGPWAVDSTPGFEHHVRTGGTAAVAPSTGVPIADTALDEDAAFIADARSSVPRLVAALTAVLDRCGEREAIATREAIAQGFADPHAYAEQSSIVTTEQIRRAVAAALEEQP